MIKEIIKINRYDILLFLCNPPNKHLALADKRVEA